MKIDETLITTGIFQQELKNRFRCVVKVDDIDEVCYVSASCRLENFIDLHNKEVQLTPSTNSSKLQHTLFAVYKNNKKKATILNLSLANAVVFEQLHRRLFSFLGSRKLARREVLVEGYKADIFIEDTKTAIEIKTIIASSGQAIFPSVKSERGLKQLEQIKVLLEKGYDKGDIPYRAFPWFFQRRGRAAGIFEPETDGKCKKCIQNAATKLRQIICKGRMRNEREQEFFRNRTYR